MKIERFQLTMLKNIGKSILEIEKVVFDTMRFLKRTHRLFLLTPFK